MTAARARFITFEGIEGAGKSTAVRFLDNYLSQLSIAHITSREPGGTLVAEAIRQVLLKDTGEPVAADTELLLMFASRAQHLAIKIKPALAAGQWVISDRFTDASYAYQGGGRGIPIERIETLENWMQGSLRPDLTFLLDIDPELGAKRLQQRGDIRDRIENEQVAFFSRAREIYLRRAQANPARYCVIDAAQALPVVQQSIKIAIDNLFGAE